MKDRRRFIQIFLGSFIGIFLLKNSLVGQTHVKKRLLIKLPLDLKDQPLSEIKNTFLSIGSGKNLITRFQKNGDLKVAAVKLDQENFLQLDFTFKNNEIYTQFKMDSRKLKCSSSDLSLALNTTYYIKTI
jgi:hypothetical protein